MTATVASAHTVATLYTGSTRVNAGGKRNKENPKVLYRHFGSANGNSADHRLPSERQQISRLDLDKISVFIIDNYFNVRAILK